jgi:hypothetical protein
MGKRTCGFMGNHNYALANETGYAQTRRMLELSNAALRTATLTQTVTIPVVVHVVYHKDSEAITDQQVTEQIEILNRDYAGKNVDLKKVPKPFAAVAGKSMIQFALASRSPDGKATTGITRTKTRIAQFPEAKVPRGADSTGYIDKEVKAAETGHIAWPREHYLNLWVCNMGKDPLGYAAFPGSAAWRDGVVIDYTCFGASGTAESPFDKGRTAVHEIGHWFDLLHIWGDDGNSCNRSDSVGDTPNQGGANYGVPTFPNVTCKNGPNGDMFMNYMDYVDDEAMYMFSKGQVARMHATLSGVRAGLVGSHALSQPHVTASLLNSPDKFLAAVADVDLKTAEEVFDGCAWVKIRDEAIVDSL